MSDVIQFPKSIRKIRTDELKRMWDRWDGCIAVDCSTGEEFSGEEIHDELNRRGEGRYCAV